VTRLDIATFVLPAAAIAIGVALGCCLPGCTIEVVPDVELCDIFEGGNEDKSLCDSQVPCNADQICLCHRCMGGQ
jgi:hypothetical protein